MTELIILPDSPEAAQLKTLSLWVSRDGRVYDDERTARWAGATHVKCGDCEAPTIKNWLYCETCRAKRDRARWAALPSKDYGGEPIVLFNDDRYFFDQDELEGFLDASEDPESVMLVFCEPDNGPEFDATELLQDHLPEDWEAPEEVCETVKALNAAIKKSAPLCWREGKVRVTFPAGFMVKFKSERK